MMTHLAILIKDRLVTNRYSRTDGHTAIPYRPTAVAYLRGIATLVLITHRQTDRQTNSRTILNAYKLIFHGSSFLVAFSYNKCHEDVANTSRGNRACRGRGCHKSRVSGSWNLENDTTHGQTGSTIQRSRPPADQSGQRVASWTGKSLDTRDILVASS